MEAHSKELENNGFTVKRNVADIPTAIIGESGSNGPVIAFLGEYDALAGLSQEPDIFEEKPIKKGGNGHGCGHNLLGSASMQAAVALRNWLVASGIDGIIRYYGCPAEEGGSGKVYMVREGYFENVDIVLNWHPSNSNRASAGSSLANKTGKFRFSGISAHAAGAPQRGRSRKYLIKYPWPIVY